MRNSPLLIDSDSGDMHESFLRLDNAIRQLREPESAWQLVALSMVSIPLTIALTVSWFSLPPTAAVALASALYGLCVLGMKVILLSRRQKMLIEVLLLSLDRESATIVP